MAETSRPPALTATSDANPYVPVSWMAVASLGVAVLFILALLGFGITSFLGKRPLLVPELLILPAVAIVLSFAGRRMIQNAEGTRTGESLTNAAWWLSLVLGLGYFAYLVAIDFSVRRDAEGEVKRWVGHLMNDEWSRAFHRTLEPGRRGAIDPTNAGQLTAEFREPVLFFRQCDVVRIAQRNKGECRFESGGLKDWNYKPGGMECVFTGTLKCPEGAFPILVGLRGFEGGAGPDGGGAGRQWMIVPAQKGYVQPEQVALTPYGWMLWNMEQRAASYGRDFIAAAAAGPGSQVFAYLGFVRGGSSPIEWLRVPLTAQTRAAIAGGPSVLFVPPADYQSSLTDSFFKLPGGATPTADQKTRFLAAWNTSGIAAPGTRLRNSLDTNDLISVTDTAVEVRVPVEIPLPGSDGELAAARGRLVVVCTDPAVMARLKELKASANPDTASAIPPEDLRRETYNWKIARLETDLYVVRVRTGPEAAGPGGPD